MERKQILKDGADKLQQQAVEQPNGVVGESYANLLMALADFLEVL